MKAITYFLLAGLLAGCGTEPGDAQLEVQAVRGVEVRQGSVLEGRRYLAEVVPADTVRVLAQVPGTVSEVAVSEGIAVHEGTALVHISAPDIAARIARVSADRGRAERERDFACAQVDTDRALAEAGDLPTIQLDRSEKGCASATLAVEAAKAAESEVSVAGRRSGERAPFDGEVLAQMVDVGQTVMPGTPLLSYGSRERNLRLRVPAADLDDIAVGMRVHSALGSGDVVEVGAQAMGPGRLVELLVRPDESLEVRPGSTTTATVVVAARAQTSSVPDDALVQRDGGSYVLLIEGTALRRVDVTVGPRQDGWVAVDPPFAEGSVVVSGGVAALELNRPVLAVMP